MSPKCPHCGGVLVPESICGTVTYQEAANGMRVYNAKCLACERISPVALKGTFPALAGTPFQPGRRWFCGQGSREGRARFWFVILRDGHNYAGKLSTEHKLCRIQIHPDDLAMKVPGYKDHGMESTYSHKHLKKYAALEPL